MTCLLHKLNRIFQIDRKQIELPSLFENKLFSTPDEKKTNHEQIQFEIIINLQ